jgi:hypothetical protein
MDLSIDLLRYFVIIKKSKHARVGRALHMARISDPQPASSNLGGGLDREILRIQSPGHRASSYVAVITSRKRRAGASVGISEARRDVVTGCAADPGRSGSDACSPPPAASARAPAPSPPSAPPSSATPPPGRCCCAGHGSG